MLHFHKYTGWDVIYTILTLPFTIVALAYLAVSLIIHEMWVKGLVVVLVWSFSVVSIYEVCHKQKTCKICGKVRYKKV